jgi:hypothetical protein
MSNQVLDISERLCQNCGYNLRGLESTRCPECGQAFDPHRVPPARIPWLQRKALGRWRAYWQTVGLAMFHPLKLGNELWNSPSVDPRGAASFRRAIIWQLCGCVMLLVMALFWSELHGQIFEHYKGFLAAFVLAPATVSIFVLLASDVGSLRGLMDLDELWRRSLRQYACAPLAAAPIVTLIAIVALPSDWLLEIIALPALLALVTWWWITNILIMHGSQPILSMSIGHAISLPMWWTICAITTGLMGIAFGSILIGLLSCLP